MKQPESSYEQAQSKPNPAPPFPGGLFTAMSRQWVWVHSDIPPKCKLDKWEKQSFVAKAEAFLTDFYRLTFLQPPPEEPRFNYVSDFSARWHGAYLIFTAKYTCPGPDALSLSFDDNFARLGYFGPNRFNIWARRHNDQWMHLFSNLTLEECFAEMRENPWFHF